MAGSVTGNDELSTAHVLRALAKISAQCKSLGNDISSLNTKVDVLMRCGGGNGGRGELPSGGFDRKRATRLEEVKALEDSLKDKAYFKRVVRGNLFLLSVITNLIFYKGLIRFIVTRTYKGIGEISIV